MHKCIPFIWRATRVFLSFPIKVFPWTPPLSPSLSLYIYGMQMEDTSNVSTGRGAYASLYETAFLCLFPRPRAASSSLWYFSHLQINYKFRKEKTRKLLVTINSKERIARSVRITSLEEACPIHLLLQHFLNCLLSFPNFGQSNRQSLQAIQLLLVLQLIHHSNPKTNST